MLLGNLLFFNSSLYPEHFPAVLNILVNTLLHTCLMRYSVLSSKVGVAVSLSLNSQAVSNQSFFYYVENRHGNPGTRVSVEPLTPSVGPVSCSGPVGSARTRVFETLPIETLFFRKPSPASWLMSCVLSQSVLFSLGEKSSSSMGKKERRKGKKA